MRSAVVAMFLAGAFAAPSAHRAHQHIHQQREAQPNNVVVTQTAVAYTTVPAGQPSAAAPNAVTHTVTLGGAPAAPSAPAQYTPPAPVQASGSAPAPAASSSAPSSGANTAGLSDFQKSALDTHNQHRANHSAPAMEYSQALEDAAKILASRCNWAGTPHDVTINVAQTGPYGQNAACGVSTIADTITGQWYNNEVGAYQWFGSEPPSSAFEATGHFTQMVWKASTKVGCSLAQCPNGVTGWPSAKSMVICNYGTPGNFAGQYAQNVMPSSGKGNMGANVGNVVNT